VDGVTPPVEFEGWYRAEYGRVLASILVLTGDWNDASEITDEAFTRALGRWNRVRVMESPEGWTYRTAVNVWRRTARRRALERRLLPWLVSRETAAAPAGEVWDLVRSLPIRQRTAVVLRYVADLTEPDIAAVMEVTRGTVASTLADARRALAAALAEPFTAEERL
jgi:RNA polymerase sigma factor (sigma-70 family)